MTNDPLTEARKHVKGAAPIPEGSKAEAPEEAKMALAQTFSSMAQNFHSLNDGSLTY